MTISEKVAFVKGLMEGLKMDESTNEGKVLTKVCDILEDIALSIADVEDECTYLSDKIDEIDCDLGEVEEELFGDYDDCGCGDDCDCCEVMCPECGEEILLEGDEIEDVISCPNCNAEIELDFDDEEEAE